MKRPNLLFLFSDQHARRVAGCYGDTIAQTPNLDALAASGVIFDNAYCPSPLCVPSRMAMLTGRHPYAQECWTNDDYLRSDAATWVHALGAGGYRPVLAGRLHSMGPDQLHGYAERTVGDHSPNWGGVPRHDLGVLNRANDPWPESLAQSGMGQSAYQVKDAETAAAACDAIRAHAAARARGSEEPLCLTVGFLLPHPPYVAWREDYEHFAGRVPPPRYGMPPSPTHPWEQWWRDDRKLRDIDPASVDRARTAYYALTYRLDRFIGEVLAALDATGEAHDTLVVYTTDHGDQLGERGLWWKHTLFEDSLRVPLLMRWPARIAAGERRAQVCNLVDVAATMVEAMGAPALPHAQGRSLLGVASDSRAPWLDETFSEHCTDTVPAWTGGRSVQQRMVRQGTHKLIYSHGDAPMLFDLARDPDERHDIASDPTLAALRDRLLARVLDGWDPDGITATIAARRREKNVIDAWARNVQPSDAFRWTLTPDLNRIERSGP